MLTALSATVGASLMPACRDEPAAVDLATIHFRSLLEIAGMIETRSISSVELTEHMLARIEDADPLLASYATMMADRAREAAAQADAELREGMYRGPLHGVPIGVKDLFYTRGVPTMGGLKVRDGFVPDHDATVVARLEAAGAVVLGKLNLTEGAFGGYHPEFEVPRNPWRADLWPGASSSGSGVATAAGLCFASLGTDTGGSIRFPSMANGIVGLKPTYGRVSRYGVLPLAESLDHVGPLARTVADAAFVLQTMAGMDSQDPTSLSEPVPDLLADLEHGAEGLRVGVDRSYLADGVDPGLVSAIDEAIEELKRAGVEAVEVEMPDLTGIVGAWFNICCREAVVAHAATYPSRADDYGPYFRDILDIGSQVTDADLSAAEALRAEFNALFEEVLSTVDAIACPAGGVPFSVPIETQYAGRAAWDPLIDQIQVRFTVPADLAGTPALSFPCGSSDDGLPYTLQLMGRALGESTLCRMGHAYQQATEWHHRHPDI